MVGLAGSVALVTGGGGGLGAATARRLRDAGAVVVVADPDGDRGSAVARELGEHAVYRPADVTDEASVVDAVRTCTSLGSLRAVVSCHGGPGGTRTVGRDGTPHDFATFRRIVDVFLAGTFNVARVAASAMAAVPPGEDGERGVIVNTASIAAFEGTIGQAAYAAAKAGIVGMTLPMARDCAVLGIRVVTIAPGAMLTPAHGGAAKDLEGRYERAVPFPKRMGRSTEFAALVEQVCVNRYLNGTTIRLDGALRFGPKGP